MKPGRRTPSRTRGRGGQAAARGAARRGPRLDDAAAARALRRGARLADVARAAGSTAAPENARRIGLSIVRRLAARGQMFDRFHAAGVTLDDICRDVRERLSAERVLLATFEGHFTDERRFPDFATRATAVEQYARLTGLLSLPAVAQEAPGALDGLDDADLAALAELEIGLDDLTDLARDAAQAAARSAGGGAAAEAGAQSAPVDPPA